MKNAAAFEQRNRELFFSVISQHLKGVYHFVRHELAYAEAVGDLMSHELAPEEVVDAVLLRAYREFVRDPPGGKIKSWLIGLAREHLDAEVKRLKSWRNRTGLRTEADVPETPPTEAVSTLGDEILDFYEPDEDLKVEDIIPDIDVPTPEQETEAKELRWSVNAALAGMPREWRRTLLLRHVDGLTRAELAKTLGRTESEVGRILEHAREYLRQKLIESGYGLREHDRGV
jgi:RNA polymerase sigma factor (sigma-70 family)